MPSHTHTCISVCSEQYSDTTSPCYTVRPTAARKSLSSADAVRRWYPSIGKIETTQGWRNFGARQIENFDEKSMEISCF